MHKAFFSICRPPLVEPNLIRERTVACLRATSKRGSKGDLIDPGGLDTRATVQRVILPLFDLVWL
jgi:hypothetical protein